MKLENQVCSLELSKRLKELGVKQESLFWYTCFKNGTADIHFQYDRKFIPPAHYSAFTVCELGEMLPYLIEYNNKKYWYHTGKVNKNNEYYPEHEVNYTNDMTTIALQRGATEADARAKLIIYLLENKLMELSNE